MSRCYTIAPAAVADLDEIWLYVARRAGIEVAERLVGSITDTLILIARNPHIGRIRPNLGAGTRSLPIGNYRIYYRQDDRGRVRILHVRHAARDESTLFGR